MKRISLLFLLLVAQTAFGQSTPQEWDDYLESIKYMSASNKDSLIGWADHLASSGYPRAEAYAYRIRGFYEDFNDNRPETLNWYLQFLEATKKLNVPDDELIAVSDLAYVYLITEQYPKAKKYIFELLDRHPTEAFSPKRAAVIFNNLGQCYKYEEKIDSALYYYNRSLDIKISIQDSAGMLNSRINLAALYISQDDFQNALKLSNQNIDFLKNKPSADLWYNLVNKAGALNGLDREAEAENVLISAMKIANSLDSKYLKQRSHEHLASIYAERGNFRKAHEELIKSNELKDELINEQTTGRIAELQESFNAKEREQENELLSANLAVQKNRQLALLIGLLGLGILVLIIGYAYQKNRRKNALINAQNEKLRLLNLEKNYLMSVVSHDLSSPFSTIKLWVQNLKGSSEKERREAEGMIIKTADFGLQTIRSILTIDRDEINEIKLEKVDLAALFKDLVTSFRPLSENKKIDLKVKVEQDQEFVLTDRSLLFRALENLLSNAIKYSEPETRVLLRCFQQSDYLCFEVKDQGPGIDAQELETLFDRYKTTKNKTTGGEQGFGLGLNIVRRIAGELGGKIEVKSKRGEGSVFTLFIPV